MPPNSSSEHRTSTDAAPSTSETSAKPPPINDELARLRHLNDQLIRSEARTRAIIEAIAEGVAVATKDGCLEVFNRAAKQIVGVGLVEANQHQWSALYSLYLPDGKTPCPTNQLPLVRAINGEHVEDVPLVVRHPDRERPVHLSVTASPFYNEQGGIDGGVAIFQDVTDRFRQETLLAQARDQLELRVQELKASEKRYQDLYEDAPDMYATVDMQSYRVLECNRTFTNATGFRKDEIVGLSVFDLHHDHCVHDLKSAFNDLSSTGVFAASEYSLKREDGERIETSLCVSPVLDDQQQPAQARCVWRDITVWKRTAESLALHREKLAHLTRIHTAGEMATGLAHELNQPLNAIVNYAGGFARRAEIGATISSNLSEAAQEIAREAQRAASIIDGLRRMVAKQNPQRAPADINELIAKAVFLCRGEARSFNTDVEFSPGPELTRITVDEIQIQQAVICLLLNAIDASSNVPKDERQVRVSATSTTEGNICIRVSDRGPGIPLDESSRIFEAFHTTKESGLGMGLAICRSITENHGGHLSFESRPGEGAQFAILLPADQGVSP